MAGDDNCLIPIIIFFLLSVWLVVTSALECAGDELHWLAA